MKKRQKRTHTRLFILLGIFLLLSLFFLMLTAAQKIPPPSQKQQQINSNPATRTYHSKLLGVTIDVPVDFSIEETFGEIFLKKGNQKIIIHRIGTNRAYKNVNEFLDLSYESNNGPKQIKRET